MIDVPVYSQRDARWRNKYVGFSRYRFATHGCTVTALASLVSHVYNEKITPDVLNDKLKSVNGFVGGLVWWYKVAQAYPKLKYIKRNYGYKNVEVAWYVYGKKTPVMVEVNAYSIGASRHWVLFLGGQKMMDPWTGKIENTSKYPPTGYTLYQIV